MDFTRLRSELPFLQGLIYFDSASVVPSPGPVVEAMNEYFEVTPFNYGVGVFETSRMAAERVDAARRTLGQFVGAAEPAREIVFTRNTTEALNAVASGIDWCPGDEIILTNVEHQSNIIPWMRLRDERQVTLKFARAGRDGIVDPAEVARLVTDNTRLINVTHVSNIFGTLQPVRDIAAIAKKHGVLFMVDAAQSLGRLPADVQQIGCDLMAICGRKGLMGPQGTGALYGRQDVLEQLRPLTIGSRGANVVDKQTYKVNPVPLRFESGVLNTSGVIGLGAAVELLSEFGMQSVRERIRHLTTQMVGALKSVPGLTLYGNPDPAHNMGIVSWNVVGHDHHELASALDRAGTVAVASGAQGSLLALEPWGVDGVVRTSVHCFNTEADIQHLHDVLVDVVKHRG